MVSILNFGVYGQQNDEVEFFLIDSFVTPEKPHTFNLTFFTNKSVKSEVIIADKYSKSISQEFLEDHSAKIDFSQFKFENKNVPFQLVAIDSSGKKYFSEVYELTLPYEEYIETKEGNDPISTILFGVALYLLPAPNLGIIDSKNYFGLTKELPVITFYSSGYNYPSSNISLEYSHYYHSPIKDILRLGYKQIYQVDLIEYFSPGISIFTDFNGYNGAAVELSLGLFKIYDVFTVYSRYRFNGKPTDLKNNFHEISIGLYSNFFTIDL